MFNSLLFSLLVLHIYWWVLIYRMLVRQIMTRNVGDDVRSGKHRPPWSFRYAIWLWAWKFCKMLCNQLVPTSVEVKICYDFTPSLLSIQTLKEKTSTKIDWHHHLVFSIAKMLEASTPVPWASAFFSWISWYVQIMGGRALFLTRFIRAGLQLVLPRPPICVVPCMRDNTLRSSALIRSSWIPKTTFFWV